MKILAGGDFHGNPQSAEQFAARACAENVDLIVLCGDITNSDEVHGPMIRPMLETGKKVLFVPGNHDSPATAQFFSEFYDIVNLEDQSFVFADVGIFGSGSVNCGIHQVDDGETLGTLAQSFEQVKGLSKKIMITHTHPSGTSIEKFSPYVRGSTAVRKAIEYFKPDVHICCHVHEAEGVEEKVGKTRIVNVGAKGKIIEI